jgi:hypothetical protein
VASLQSKIHGKVVGMLICSVVMKKGGIEAGLWQECNKKEESRWPWFTVAHRWLL